MPYEITLFLIGSGMALFIALLGWSYQIRHPQKEVQELEEEFRRKWRLKRKELKPILKAGKIYERDVQLSFFEEIKAIAGVMSKVKDRRDIKLIGTFKKSKVLIERLEHLYDTKYKLTILLTALLLGAGFLSFFVGSAPLTLDFKSYVLDTQWNTVFFILPFLLILFILVEIIKINKVEEDFKKTIKEITDIL